MNEFAAVVTAGLLAVLVMMGVMLLGFGTLDHQVINNCRDQGWYNFGQTRIICSVEPKKEAK